MERLSVKARQPKQAEQRRRRAELLERQRSRRADRTAQNRGMGDGGDAGGGGGCGHAEWMGETDGGDASAPMLDTSEPLPAGAGDDAMQTEGGGGGGRRRRPAGREAALMAPEWMVDVPEDLPSCWSVVARPAGVRCLVTTGGGETRRHAKGCAPRRFPSALPGGRRAAGGVWGGRDADQVGCGLPRTSPPQIGCHRRGPRPARLRVGRGGADVLCERLCERASPLASPRR